MNSDNFFINDRDSHTWWADDAIWMLYDVANHAPHGSTPHHVDPARR
jgi:hypothetical protein